MSEQSAGAALSMAGLRDSVIGELQHRGLCDLARLAKMRDADLLRIPHVGSRAVGIIRACVEAA